MSKTHFDWSSESLAALFGIDMYTYTKLFLPSYAEQADGRLPERATPKQWVQHARKIYQDLQDERVS